MPVIATSPPLVIDSFMNDVVEPVSDCVCRPWFCGRRALARYWHLPRADELASLWLVVCDRARANSVPVRDGYPRRFHTLSVSGANVALHAAPLAWFDTLAGKHRLRVMHVELHYTTKG